MSGTKAIMSKIKVLLLGNGDGSGQMKRGSNAIRFSSFSAVPVVVSQRPLLSEAERASQATSIGEAIAESLKNEGSGEIEILEVYMPLATSDQFQRFFLTSDQYSAACKLMANRVFSGFVNEEDSDNRFVLHKKAIHFHPAFDPVLRDRLLVRWLQRGQLPIFPTDYTPQFKQPDGGQHLLGQLEVTDKKSSKLVSLPFYAWRGPARENRVLLHIDFDLLAKALPIDFHRFPIGGQLMCGVSANELTGIRTMLDVTLNFADLQVWTKYADPRAGVRYSAVVGGGRTTNDLHLHTTPIRVSQNVAREYDAGGGRKYPINRYFGVNVKTSDESWTYHFGFFEKVPSYDPKQNVLRMSGQLISANGVSQVTLPPQMRVMNPRVAFAIEADRSDSRKFIVTVPSRLGYQITIAGSPMQPGKPYEVHGDQTIIAQPEELVGTEQGRITYEFRPLSTVPSKLVEYARTQGNSYVALMHIASPDEYNILLDQREYLFGKQRLFPAQAPSILDKAIALSRPYVQLELTAINTQEAFLVNLEDPSAAKKIGTSSPERLALNGEYELYVGDYRLSFLLNSSQPIV